MSSQETPLDSRSAGFVYFLHPLLIIIFLAGANVGVSILAQHRFPSGSVHGDTSLGIVLILIATIVLLVIEVISFSVALLRRSSMRALVQALAIILLVSSIVFGRSIAVAVQYVNLFVFPHVFQACMQGAQAYRADAKFNLCNAQSFGNNFSVIVYDSGGEIARSAAQWSPAFKALLKAQQSPLLSQCKVAPGQHLHNAFYLVNADCDSSPDE